MVGRLLRATDSFNSSSATIKAENDDERRPAQLSSFVHAGNILMPQDTLGRELLAIASSSQEHPPNGLYVTEEYVQLPPTPPAGQDMNMSFNTLLNSVSDASDDPIFNQIPTSTHNAMAVPDYRPSSAHSHYSDATDVSGSSEFSYATTEMDDDEMAEYLPEAAQHLANTAQMEAFEQIRAGFANMGAGNLPQIPQGTVAPSSVSPPPIGLHAVSPPIPAGPSAAAHNAAPPNVKTVAVPQPHQYPPQNESAAAKQKRLEHRRQINRKSAQKHRERRRVELDTLTEQLTVANSRIKVLEQALEVAQQKIVWLEGMLPGHDSKPRSSRRVP